VRLAAIGDNCIDIYTNLGLGCPGGGPVNFAVQARRAGADTAYVGVIGDDEHGEWLKAALVAEGVDVRHLLQVPGPTAVAYVRLEGNERTFIGADRGVRLQLRVTSEIDDYLADFDLIHTTLDGLVDEAIPRWYAAGRRVSYDFSHRARPEQFALLPHVYVAFFSGQKISWADGPARLRSLYQSGGPVLVMTFGADGSLAFDGAHYYDQPALPTQLVDTLGAGDAFQAGFMLSYLEGGSIPEALRRGAQLAAQACGRLGGFNHEHRITETSRGT